MASASNTQTATFRAHEPAPKVVDTRFGPMEYAEFGEGPAVLAIHGAMGGHDQSLLLARTVGDEGYHYIGISRPGYLGTPLSSGRGPEQQADLCAALLDELRVESALLMAVSGGGPCALQFALRHRERCRGLVLVSTCGRKVNTRIPFSFHIARLLVRVPGFASSMRRKVLANVDQAASRSIPDPKTRARVLDDPEVGPLFRALMESTSDHVNKRMGGTENDIRITRTNDYRLDQIATPVLIVHGTEDSMVPYDLHAKALESGIPGAELLTVEGGEHVAIFTHREQVRPRVARFLREHSAPG